MSPHQSKLTSYSSRSNSVPAFPQFETVFRWGTGPSDEGMGAIINGTIGRSWNWFHLLNQSSKAELPDSMLRIVLLPGVCGDISSSTRNCSDLCSRPLDMFSSWRTLWHCLSLASLSIAGTSFPGLNESSHELINTALRNFSIPGAANFPGETVLNNTFECAFASCKADEGECKMKDLNSSYIVDGHVQLNVLHESAIKLCEGVEAEIDADIAGPGVVLSYIFQAAIAVYVWVFLAVPSAKAASKDLLSILPPLSYCWPGLNCESLLTRFSTTGFKIPFLTRHSPTLQRFWANLVHATSSFLVEFHEAQCFFVASVDIALLYANSRQLPSGTDSMETLYQFRALIELVGSTSAWSVILSQTSLYRARLNSVYYMALSTIALVLSTATVLSNPVPSAENTHKVFKGLNNISECGGNTSLRSFCLRSSGRVSSVLPPEIIYFCPIAVVLFWVLEFPEMLKIICTDQMYRLLIQGQRGRYPRVTHALPHITNTAMMVFIGFEAYIIFFLSSSLLSLGHLQKKVGADEWGVGQVIAVLIWAPVFSKYLYLIIFGIEKGFFHRISRAFKVVKRPTETENDEGGTARGGEGNIAPGDEEDVAPGDEENIAPSDEGDIALGDATGADTVPLIPVHRNTAAW